MQLFFNFILSAGISLTVILLVVNLKKKSPHRNAYLGLLFVVCLFVCVYSYSEQNNLVFLSQLTFLVADAVGFILGPTIFFYVKSIYGDLPRLRKTYWIHYTPLILYTFFISGPILLGPILWPTNNSLSLYIQTIEAYQVLLQTQAFYWVFYAILALVELKKYKLQVQQNYSSLHQKDAQWLKHILNAILFFIGNHLMIELVSLQLESPFFSNGILSSLFFVLVIAYIGYHGIEQAPVKLSSFDSKDKAPKQHHLYNADQATITDLTTKLQAVLVEEKPYLDEQLSLAQLAKQLSISDKKLSALLNHHIGESFYDLINRHRVDHAKSLILDPNYEHYTFLAIGMEAGFSSKSSFNRIFKKVVGQSPSQFRKDQLSSPK